MYLVRALPLCVVGPLLSAEPLRADDIPDGVEIPDGEKKQQQFVHVIFWGTCHPRCVSRKFFILTLT